MAYLTCYSVSTHTKKISVSLASLKIHLEKINTNSNKLYVRL